MGLEPYPGFLILAMASARFTLAQVAPDQPDRPLWQTLAYHLDHVPWRGGGFWDLIQPSFMFMVGVAMPFSYANRLAQGQSWAHLFTHALGRSLILIALGIFLSSAGGKYSQTNFT